MYDIECYVISRFWWNIWETAGSVKRPSCGLYYNFFGEKINFLPVVFFLICICYDIVVFICYYLKNAETFFLQTTDRSKTIVPIQKQLLADVFQNRCSWKFRNIYKKIFVLESLKACNFIKKDSETGVFMWILQNF